MALCKEGLLGESVYVRKMPLLWRQLIKNLLEIHSSFSLITLLFSPTFLGIMIFVMKTWLQSQSDTRQNDHDIEVYEQGLSMVSEWNC